MHIIFQKDQLNKALNILSKASSNRVSSNLPGTIYISTKVNTVEMEANDFEIGIRLNLEAEIIEEGTILIASKYFSDMVKRMPEDKIELYQEENTNTIFIRSGKAEYNMITYNVDDFIFVENIKEDISFTMDTTNLKELIDLTTYSVATDDSRPIFTGVLLEIEGNEITMVGTDTHRLAIKKIKVEENFDFNLRVTIPVKILNEISRLLPVEMPQMITITCNKTQIAFLFDNVYMISRLIEGEFPNYKTIIPERFDSSASLDRRQVINSIERVSLLANDSYYQIINFDWQDNKVILSSKNLDIGTAKEEIPCHFEGNNFSICFNGKYIIDILKHSNCNKVYFFLIKGSKLVIRLDENPNYTYVVSPINTEN